MLGSFFCRFCSVLFGYFWINYILTLLAWTKHPIYKTICFKKNSKYLHGSSFTVFFYMRTIFHLNFEIDFTKPDQICMLFSDLYAFFSDSYAFFQIRTWSAWISKKGIRILRKRHINLQKEEEIGFPKMSLRPHFTTSYFNSLLSEKGDLM